MFRFLKFINTIILVLVTHAVFCQNFSFLQPKEKGCLSKKFLKKIVDCFDVRTFIESGTYAGDSTAIAETLFDVIHTMELSRCHFDQAQKRFARSSNIHVHFGDSGLLLPDILNLINGATLFWLDGHFSKGNTAKGSVNTPICDELRSIEEAGLTDSVILIDDIRLFHGESNAPDDALTGYPSLQELFERLRAIHPSFSCYIFGDVIIAFSVDKYQVEFCPLVKACTASRLFRNGDTSYKQIIEVEKVIAQLSRHDQDQLLAAIQPFSGYGAGHYYLWRGLVAESRNQISKAMEEYINAAQYGVNDLRPQLYFVRCLARLLPKHKDTLNVSHEISASELQSFAAPCVIARFLRDASKG